MEGEEKERKIEPVGSLNSLAELELHFSSDSALMTHSISPSSTATPVSGMSLLALEDGEITKINSAGSNELLDILIKIICDLFRHEDKEGEDEEADGECDYVLKRNLLITLWHLRSLIAKGTGEIITDLVQILEKVKSTEEREDLKVLSTRVYLELSSKLGIKREEIEVSTLISAEAKEPMVEKEAAKEVKKEEPPERKRKASEASSPSQKKAKSEEKQATPPLSPSSHGGTTSSYHRSRHHDYYGPSSTLRRDHREHREHYESSSGSYYRGSSSRWQQQQPPR